MSLVNDGKGWESVGLCGFILGVHGICLVAKSSYKGYYKQYLNGLRIKRRLAKRQIKEIKVV